MVSPRPFEFVGVAFGMGIAYAVLERQTDAWPALLVFAVGGALCGYRSSSRWTLAICPVAGGLGNVIWYFVDRSDSSAVELSFPLVVLLGLAVGATGTPTTLFGMYMTSRSARATPGSA